MSDLRERFPRITQERLARRRRQPDSLNRLVGSNLGLPDECVDPEYHYHWVNDVRGKPQNMMAADDYEVVTMEMLEETAREKRAEFTLSKDAFQTGIAGGVSRVVERDGTRAVLLRKPKDLYDYDYEMMVAQRQAMMEQRIFEGQGLDMEADGRVESLEGAYVPKGNTLGDMAPRRRGRIPNRLK